MLHDSKFDVSGTRRALGGNHACASCRGRAGGACRHALSMVVEQTLRSDDKQIEAIRKVEAQPVGAAAKSRTSAITNHRSASQCGADQSTK